MKPKFRGIFIPLQTTFTEDGEVDFDIVGELTQFMMNAGVHGLFVLGSTGMVQIGVDVLNPMFATAKAQGLIREEIEVNLLIEWLLRVLWTYLNAPSQVATDEEGMRKLFRMMLIPAVLKDA